MSEASYALDWVKQVDTILHDLEEKKPEFGAPFTLDWEGVEQDLATLFNQSDLSLSHTIKGWVGAEEIWQDSWENLYTLAIDWRPLNEPVYFITESEDLKRLLAELVGGEKKAAFFYETDLIQGFYHYLTSEMLSSIETRSFAAPLSPHISQFFEGIPEKIAQKPVFLIEVALTINEKTFWGKILLSEKFQKAWKTYFARLPQPAISEELKKKLHVNLALEVGRCDMKLSEFQAMNVGDFLLLDYCSYDPEMQKGGFVMTLNHQPIFRGKIKEGGVKITQYPLYNEVAATMEDKPFHHEGEEDEDFLEDFEEDDEDAEEDEAVNTSDFENFQPGGGRKEEAVQEKATGEKPSISGADIPIQLTVEVGRIKMTAQELMNLTPGSFLDIHVSPEQGVDLVVNGVKVGKGELLRMGESLGVRILS